MLNLITHDAITEINMARPPVNALNIDLLRAIRDAVDNAVASGARGIVFSGLPGMFSAGVDVPSLLGRDRDGVRDFWREFFATCSKLAMSPERFGGSSGIGCAGDQAKRPCTNQRGGGSPGRPAR